MIYTSTDSGESWKIIMNGLDYSRFDWNIPYMKPQYNGGGNCVHWISDIKLSPLTATQPCSTQEQVCS